jgi:cell wall-associated NlpC family hydrolase
VGQYGAKIGRVPAGGYVETILQWAEEYARLFAQTVSGSNGSAPPAGASGSTDAPSSTTTADASSSGSPGQPASAVAQSLIQYGMTLLGTPYVFGGKFIARDNGIDCSGFVCEIFEHCGYRLGDREYLSADAIRQMTRAVQEAEAITGDLIFFQNTYDTPGASHIGIWIADGKMLDCHTHGGAQVTDVHQTYWQEHFLALGRLPQFEHLPPPAPVTPVPAPPPEEIVPQEPAAESCSFCGRSKDEVGRLIGSTTDPLVAICDSCITLYNNLIGQAAFGRGGRYM